MFGSRLLFTDCYLKLICDVRLSQESHVYILIITTGKPLTINQFVQSFCSKIHNDVN